MQLDAFVAELAAIRRQHGGAPGPEDLAHLRKVERWTRALALLGYGTAWIAPNPLSMLAISTARFARWAMLSHHVLHQAYDRVPGAPERYTSRVWGRGLRRLRDWMDWMDPPAWVEEHNNLHHARLGETADPDLPEDRVWLLRDPRLPAWLRWLLVGLSASLWKPLYYAPTLQRARWQTEQRARREAGEDAPDPGERPADPWVDWSPFSPVGRRVWLRSWLPYILIYFVALPSLVALISPAAGLALLLNLLGAELLTNWHAFLVIVPNHAGEDVWRFDAPATERGEFFVRQIVGSVNYHTGSDGIDFLHGWLNYQIEHHLFPNASMLQLQRMQPEVKALCARHGLPYVQEPVWRRAWKLVELMVGRTSMRRLPAGERLPWLAEAGEEAPEAARLSAG